MPKLAAATPQQEAESKRKRGAIWVLVLVLVAAFGPYLLPGLRTEQLTNYLLVIVALPFLLGKRTLPQVNVAVLFLWGALAAVVAVSTISSPQVLTPWPPGSRGAGVDNVVMPLALLIITLAVVPSWRAGRALRLAAFWVVILMMLNVAASAVTLATGKEWTQWWSSDETSTAARALGQARISGLINQPSEAGVLYGAAVLCALYLWSGNPKRLIASLGVLLVGGMLTVSKIFFMIALPLLVWHLVRTRETSTGKRISVIAIGLIALFGALQAGAFRAWQGAEQLSRQLLPEAGKSLVEQATGNRFGSTSTLGVVIEEVLNHAPFFGFGAGGLEIAYDNAWVEQLVTGGLFGLILYTAVLIVMFAYWRRSPRSPERTLLGSLLLLAIGAGVGLPSLTANRVVTVMWILLSVTLIAVDFQRECRATYSREEEGTTRKSTDRGEFASTRGKSAF